MKREVVETFLNLPGIAGIALMDGRSRPYFHGVDQTLNSQQKETVAQGLQQIVQTTPVGFEFFEYQFTGYQVYIHKLKQGVILLVLADLATLTDQYFTVVEQLKTEFYDDTANAVATFRLIAGTLSATGQPQKKQTSETTDHVSPTSSLASSLDLAQTPTVDNSQLLPSPIDAPASGSVTPTTPVLDPQPDLADLATLKEVLAALNHFSQFTTQYLGATVVTNYWTSTRPDIDWLSQFQVDRSAQISVADALAERSLSPEQHQWVRDWTAAFIQRCSKVIRDFPSIIKQRALDDHQKALLLSD
jgi:hypothetical protein